MFAMVDPWQWVMDWKDMLSTANMTLILDKFFFPRWLQTLAMWLNHSPNYTQVTEWYSGWKRMLSDDLLTQPTIKGESELFSSLQTEQFTTEKFIRHPNMHAHVPERRPKPPNFRINLEMGNSVNSHELTKGKIRKSQPTQKDY